jgi:hypothetical protein
MHALCSNRGSRFPALALALLLQACSDGSDHLAGGRVAYPNDDVLRLNQIQVMGTHNSYHPGPAPEPMATVVREQFSFYYSLTGDYRHKPLYEQLDRLGVRHIELDVNADPEGGNFSERPLLATVGADTATGIPELDEPGLKVFHVPQIDAESSCHLFTDCLRIIRQWSREHPGHVPIIVMVEIKDIDFFNTATYLPMLPWQVEDYDRLDAEIRSVFPPEHLITPDDVRGDFSTLEEAILTRGWPTLASTRGKLMFTLCNCFGDDRRRMDYEIGHENLEGRVIFPNSKPGNPDAAVVHLEEPESDFAEIQRLAALGYFIRTRADANTREAVANYTGRREAAFASGSHYVATDFPEPSETAHPDYYVKVPDGKPAGCNPVTAPDWCTPEDIENPTHLARGSM